MTMTAKSLRRISIVLAAGAALFGWQQAIGADAPAAPATAAAATDAEGVIFERQQVMKQLDDDAKLLGQIVAGLAPKEKLLEATRAVAQDARDSVEAFKPQIPGGRSKPEVWSNYPDFNARMEKFAKNADAMAKLAETGNMTAVISTMAEALPCKECHDLYRAPKKS